MMRLCLLLLSCCAFGSCANNLIKEIIQDLNAIEQNPTSEEVHLKVPEEVSKSTGADLHRFTESLETLEKHCNTGGNCTDKLRKHLEKALSNLRLLKCPDVSIFPNSSLGRNPPEIKEVKLIQFLTDFKRVLRRLQRRRMC